MTLAHLWSIAKQSVTAWVDDYAPSMGAALAYYTLFSIAPLILIVASIAGIVFGEAAARGQIFGELRGLMGEPSAAAIEALLRDLNKPNQGIVGTVIGVAALLVGATGVFSELQTSLDRIWLVPARPGASGIFSLLRSRLLSFGMVLGIGFLLIISLLASAAISALGQWFAPEIAGWEAVAQGITFLLGLVLVTVMFAMIYKVMPRARIGWRDVWIGAAVTSLLFNIGKFAIGFYLGKAGLTSGFGAAGSLIVLLIWTYYSAQIFLLGAEFTWVFAYAFGSRQGLATPSGAQVPEFPPPEASTIQRLERSREAMVAALRAGRRP
ncbi:MAG: YihY/virulence factor BrkB family protein [Pseudomonadota bacterium]|nr:YihY/virulence factor BrkB family protein [Pseudomonadota bacterium]